MEQVMNFVSLAWPFLVLVGIMYFFMYRPQQKLKVERGRFLMSLRKRGSCSNGWRHSWDDQSTA